MLAVPPKTFPNEYEKRQHALRQATYQDDSHGNFAPGLRVNWDMFLPHLDGEDAAWVEQVRHGGIPLQLHHRPAAYCTDNEVVRPKFSSFF